ncbi:fido domain-containing protein [Paraphysoderma sedebokerense]|nr:fido domain-containing protein [Paraphysoderma sedebokerense]
MEPNPDNRIHIKVWNLHRAINRYFNSDFFDAFEMQQFTPALAKDINISLLSGLEDRAGIYRQLWAMPAQEDFYYLDPQKISNRLDELFENVVKKYRDSYGWDEARRLEHLVKLGAAFLEEFLYIHPFSNGNGRTGRILLSLLLSEFSVIPVSLFLRQMDREDYLKCLREARLYNPKCPMALARFILDSVDRTLRNALYCLDLYEELPNLE